MNSVAAGEGKTLGFSGCSIMRTTQDETIKREYSFSQITFSLSLFFNVLRLHLFILTFFKRRYFNSTSSSNLWTDVVHALAQFAVIDALHTAVELLNDGDKPDDASALVHLLRVSGNHDYVYLCRQLHGYILKHGWIFIFAMEEEEGYDRRFTRRKHLLFVVSF
ncbi:hypothetical protein F2Q68_00035997 [Brassica cretica]|uniref:Uncharacterized protein n=1 Tax=Brassica cretica TaxID=69181 RepID=A0A8S9H1K8_BRACR|nr:hypothetical protein F2Q68_00035997 [Brassica cretica]